MKSPNWFSQKNPKKPMTRAEGCAAIAKFMGYSETSTIKIDHTVFKDVSGSHWLRPYLAYLLQHKLITPSVYFYPKRILTVAELTALIAKTPAIKTQLNALFP